MKESEETEEEDDDEDDLTVLSFFLVNFNINSLDISAFHAFEFFYSHFII